MTLQHSIMTLGLLSCLPATAATVSWTSGVASQTAGALDAGTFDASGTFVMAENLGRRGGIFDGITFADSGTIASQFPQTSPATFHDFNENTVDLSSYAGYGGTGATTVTLTGLTNNHTYRIQALVYDGTGGGIGRTVKFDGINQGQYANGVAGIAWGDGLLITGTFTADAESQGFTIEIFNSSSVRIGAQLNAITVYKATIPEPSTFALLLGLTGLAFTMIRRL